VTHTTHKRCCKFPSESPCLRCTALPVQPALPIKLPVAAGHQFHPPCDQQTGPDRTTVNPADITRQFTSLIALGLIAARSGGLHHGAQLWEREGVELSNVSSVLLRLC